MSALLTPQVAEQAVALVAPMIEEMLKSGITKRSDLHVVVLNPLDGNLLYERSWGDIPNWKWDYKTIALKKAQLSFATDLDTHVVQQCMPHLLTHGDTKYRGGVSLDRIAVGVSGVEDYWDEFFAHCIAAACRALCTKQMVRVMEDPSDVV